ncbi:MAG: hypothetical protein H7A24_01480 [Leptospiraceae bacterium]|nr:hypothetical protein [Leptospiraceae bacterium]MCP5510525.1 hypothetical protein [Leptospiraceae bacterium]
MQDGYIYLLWLVLFLSSAGFLWVLYKEIVYPYILISTKEVEPPPEVGKVYEFIVSESERNSFFSVGKTTGNIVTRCSAIQEDHLIFQFKKDPSQEEYDIQIKKNGAVLFKPPRMPTYSTMDSTEKLESHEVIGKTADFRISNVILKERMVNFIEISLTSKFIITKSGKERLQFRFTITKIHPGLNLNSPDKTGNFPWGKDEQKAEESFQEQEDTEE